MNIRKYIFLLAISSLSIFTACRGDDPTPTPTPKPTPTEKPDPVNDFVWKAMNSWYYWQANVPSLADSYKSDNAKYVSLINGKTPDKLFYSLLYQYGKMDRFSWIENNNKIINPTSRIAEVEKDSGLHIGIYPKGQNSSNYVALVHYVVPGSSAANAGIKRGDVITKINGAYITDGNMGGFDADSYSVTRAETVVLSADANGYAVLTTTDKSESISLVTTDIDENPIAFSKVFELGGKKIGYLVYNGFKIDYNSQLNAKFAEFKAAGINELILDLRYNGGGSLTTALGLAQMINGNYTNQNYVYLDYNDKHNIWDGFDTLSNKLEIFKVVNGHPEKTGEESVNSLSLPRVYILQSFQTASASELTISSLNKYVPVTTVGWYTVGKFVGSHTLYDSPNDDWTNYEKRNTAHNWQLQPITFAYYNKDKDAHPVDTGGDVTITPNNRIHPYYAFNNIKEFGNTSDPELKKALELITGTTLRTAGISYPEMNPNVRVVTKEKNPAKGLYINDINEYLKRKRN